MWPFVFILAIIPMIYYWSDSVVQMFPSLAVFLPEKSDRATPGAGHAPTESLNATTVSSVRWVQNTSDAGYVAWILSKDEQYRVAVGCRKNAEPVMQLTHISGKPVEERLLFDGPFGQLPLLNGFYQGESLLDAVAQFSAVTLTMPSSREAQRRRVAPAVVAKFSVAAQESGLVARALQQHCAQLY